MSEKELKGVSITSSTTRTLALAKSKFCQVTEVSPDGAWFMAEPRAFKAEALAQAQELYCSRDMGADTHYLRHLDRLAPEDARDTPDLATLVRQAPWDASVASR